MMAHLRSLFSSSSFPSSSLKASTSDTSFTVKEADDFSYTDPIDGSVSTKQGLYIKFTDGSRVIFRLSGTGSSGATVRLYVEKYSKNEDEYGLDAQDGLKPLIEVALAVSKLKEFTGRDKPDVITVSSFSGFFSTEHELGWWRETALVERGMHWSDWDEGGNFVKRGDESCEQKVFRSSTDDQ